VRIVAGKLKGRSILSPGDEPIRPTSDRVRQAIFNMLAHGRAGMPVEGARVLDLFAGTGALGIEALSRGAVSCLFVENAPAACGLIRRSLAMLNVDRVSQVVCKDATALGPASGQAFNLVFLDPPYGKGLGERALEAAAAGGWLGPGAMIVLEERADVSILHPQNFELVQQRTWGDTQASFFRYASPQQEVRQKKKRTTV
jgi:16S rRNA (guanine966-N2)-methyltransferase